MSAVERCAGLLETALPYHYQPECVADMLTGWSIPIANIAGLGWICCDTVSCVNLIGMGLGERTGVYSYLAMRRDRVRLISYRNILTFRTSSINQHTLHWLAIESLVVP